MRCTDSAAANVVLRTWLVRLRGDLQKSDIAADSASEKPFITFWNGSSTLNSWARLEPAFPPFLRTERAGVRADVAADHR